MRVLLAATVLCLLAGCARAPAPPEAPSRAFAFSEAYYREAAARGEAVFRIDRARSAAVVRVYRAGPLARFGHDHVVATRAVRGFVHLAQERSRADLYVPLARLEVDPPALRAEAGFEGELRTRDIEATRRNMLDRVLEAERFPWAYLRLRPIALAAGRARLAADLTLHGQTQRLEIEARLTHRADGTLEISGAFPLAQTDFGIAPFSALGGALRVADRVDVAFRLYAVPVSGPG